MDLLICEFQLPETGGISAYRLIRFDSRPSAVFMGFMFSERERKAAFELGAITVLKRPLTEEAVDFVATRFLRRRRMDRW